jgi:hypothetical protein
MKGLKTLMTVVAFALAIGGAFGFKSLNHSSLRKTGWVNMGSNGLCAEAFIPGDCGTTGSQICTSDNDTYYQNSACSNPYFFTTE